MRKNLKEAECNYCKEVKGIAAKGLCVACYSRLQKTGSVEYKRVKNTCNIEGCDSFVVSHGLCDKHRKRVSRNGQAAQTRPDDWGKREKHPIYVYWLDTKRRQSLNISDDWRNDFWAFVKCVHPRPTKNHYLRAVDIHKPLSSDNWQWVEGLTDANRKILSREKKKNHDKNRLNLSAEERDKLLIKADHKCQICGVSFNDDECPVTGQQSPKTLCIDHCHDTGEVRGVLCRACNSGLGHFKDDISLLNKAADYLNNA